MHARALDDAAAKLRELRHEEGDDLGLAGLTLALAVAAARVYPGLALPLFLGAVIVGARGVRALWRRWDLVDRLAGERDAYVISEVLEYASRQNTMERRLTFAALIRFWANEPVESRLRIAVPDLDELADASSLSTRNLRLPANGSSAMPSRVRFLNTSLSAEDLRSRVRQIRSSFSFPWLAA